MTFDFNPYSAPLLFGFVQGWVYALLLWVRGWREERLSDLLLGWVLVGCSFNIWEYMLGFGGIEILWRELEFFPRSLGLLFPPLCYFYLKSQFNALFRFRANDALHAVPFLIDTTYHVLVFSRGSDFVESWKQRVHEPYHVADVVFVVSTGLSVFYLYRALKLYRAYRQWTETQFSDADLVSFRWFRNFLLAMAASLVVNLTMIFLDQWLNLSFWQDWWDELFGAFLIYYVSIEGYAQAQPTTRLRFQKTDPEPVAPPAQVAKPALKSPALRPEEFGEWREKLLRLMDEEKPYLEPGLSLASLAWRLHTNASVLSQLINTGTNHNFNDFVNQYRVEEFNRQVSNPANAHLSQLGIALNCGFNSKATFNRAYKKWVGVTPTEYLRAGASVVVSSGERV
jgi:AraC-like DNA-binding protein